MDFILKSSDQESIVKILESLLPQTIISSHLEPVIEKKLFTTISKCISQELEIYRKLPKITQGFKNEQEDVPFDPRNNDTCFMGKKFRNNSNVTSYALSEYRKHVGTIPHPEWGNCTLLEIWGGDHFEEHNKMVTDAFKYGMGLIKTKPTIKVYVNPLFQNKKSKEFRLSAAQQQYKDDMELLMAKALVFGVNEKPKRRRK